MSWNVVTRSCIYRARERSGNRWVRVRLSQTCRLHLHRGTLRSTSASSASRTLCASCSGSNGFGRKTSPPSPLICALERFFQVAGDENDFRGRAGVASASSAKSRPLISRHDHVGEEEVDLLVPVERDEALRVVAAGGLERRRSRASAERGPRCGARPLRLRRRGLFPSRSADFLLPGFL